MKSENFHLGERIYEAFRSELQKHGYVTTTSDVMPNHEGNYTQSDVSSTKADALLGIQIDSIGYQKGLFSSDYGPVAIVTAKIISTKTGDTLYEQTYWYGLTDESGRIMKYLAADQRYTFNSYDSLLSNGPLASSGLAALAPLLASAVANAMSK